MQGRTKKTRMGRPPIPPEKRKRPPMGFRPTPDIRKKIEESAAQSGLSLTQEIERRLERSFWEEGALYAEFGGKEQYELVRRFADIANLVSAVEGKSWVSSWEGYKMAEGAWDMLFSMLIGAPKGTHADDEKAMFKGAAIIRNILENASTDQLGPGQQAVKNGTADTKE